MVRVKRNHAAGLDEASANLVIESLGCAVLVLDSQGRVARANAAFRAMTSQAPAALAGLAMDRLGRLFEGDADLSGLLAEVKAKGQSETWLQLAAPGRARSRTLHCTARRISGGRREAYLLVFEDAGAADPLEPHRDAELGHRVKNSLQIIAAFVAAEQRRVGGPSRASYAAIGSRIVAVSTLYDLLSRSGNCATLEGDRLLDGLAEALRRALLGETSCIAISVEAEPVWLAPEQVEAVGLMVNELATNAIKHAFPEGCGQIRLGLRREGPDIVLEVSDNGRGIPAEARSGLGSRYVVAFARQLRGDLSRQTGPGGTRHEIRFPLAGAPIPLGPSRGLELTA
ncbi:sensor histidine kinase [Phenylobacterium soli]|uniref:histidine kinase n=1 Tax=Phenylobacterium soli TaxID=2170551 RepID=A0A328ANH1_9CAUL|nr:PAS domain-containing sensor histidine kinase [Phenylobacterium soli]RAK56119.1 hypothetical protein DJ017_17170 [Phenylobacterium soli]